jgi:hypothetical protein
MSKTEILEEWNRLWRTDGIKSFRPRWREIGADDDVGAGSFNVAIGETDVDRPVGMVEQSFVDRGTVGPGEAIRGDGSGGRIYHGVGGDAVVVGVVVTIRNVERPVICWFEFLLKQTSTFLPLICHPWTNKMMCFFNIKGEKRESSWTVISGLLIQIRKLVGVIFPVNQQSQINLLKIAHAANAFAAWFSIGKRGQKQHGQNGQDGNDHENINQGKAVLLIPWSHCNKIAGAENQHQLKPETNLCKMSC